MIFLSISTSPSFYGLCHTQGQKETGHFSPCSCPSHSKRLLLLITWCKAFDVQGGFLSSSVPVLLSSRQCIYAFGVGLFMPPPGADTLPSAWSGI